MSCHVELLSRKARQLCRYSRLFLYRTFYCTVKPWQISQARLELVNLVLLVAKLLQDTSELALVLGANLVAGDGLVQAGRTADEDLDVLALRLGQNLLEELLGDVTGVTPPLFGSLVECVKGTETLGVGVLELGELLLEKDVLLSEVSEDEGDLCLIVGVVEDGAAELVHGGDTGSASNESDVVVLVLGPGVLGEGSLDVESLSRGHVVHVCAHGAVRVLLDQEVHEALLACDL